MNLINLPLVSSLALTTSSSRLGLVRSFAFRPSSPASLRFHRIRQQGLLLRRFSSLISEQEPSEEDLQRWEQMYQAGESRNKQEAIDLSLPASSLKSEVRVISFDLDNTLWKTSSTIDAANDALAAFLSDQNIVQPVRVEKVMGELFRANKPRYCPVDPENAKAPTSLTLLRKDAIQKVLEEHNDYSTEQAIDFAEQAFDCWTKARHDAIPGHFASSVETCLKEIAELRTSKGHPVLIGAITDGNSDPRNIKVLREYFNFCVNAETVGVSKPDKRVYLEAVSQVASHPSLSDVLSTSSAEDALEDSLGPFWVHVGDDFVKDIVAAKSLNMRSIWVRELVLDKEVKGQPSGNSTTSSRSVEQLVKEVAEMKVVKMQVGSEDYLAESFQNDFVDASTDRFSELSSILREWHGEGLGANKDDEKVAPPTPTRAIPISSERPATTTTVQEAVLDATEPTSGVAEQKNKKFCIHCGESLPLAAKFCSACGEKQDI